MLDSLEKIDGIVLLKALTQKNQATGEQLLGFSNQTNDSLFSVQPYRHVHITSNKV